MTAQEKVQLAEERIRGVIARELPELDCPFCEQKSEPGQMLCCESLADMVTAITGHLEFMQYKQMTDRVLDRINSSAWN